MYKYKLSNDEKILLSRICKLDRKMKRFIVNHKDESMNKLLPKTDFIKNANKLYNGMSKKLILISLNETKYTHNIVNINEIIKSKEI